jgi:general stress protein 26
MSQSDTVKRFRSLLETTAAFMMTSRDEEGNLHARPMIYYRLPKDPSFYFVTAPNTAKIEQIIHDQNVNLSHANPVREQETGSVGGEWFSIAGKAFGVHDQDTRDAILGDVEMHEGLSVFGVRPEFISFCDSGVEKNPLSLDPRGLLDLHISQ